MRIFTYALLGMLAVQTLIATPALAEQKVKTVHIEVSSFSSKPISASAIENAFKTCSAERGWKFTRAAPGKLIGKLNVRGKHSIEVLVEYSSEAYKISYQNSRNMRYYAAENTIHKRYNSWVKNLSNDVIFCLQ
jgi:hypothetical protein